MPEISAFVGHSFNPEDQDVVRKFLEFLDTVARTLGSFSWDHAQAAEPRVLSEKVLALLDGKNAFIGICTRKEIVLQEQDLLKARWPHRRLRLRNDDLVWKPSDWLIQEVGLAIGRGLRVILLLESGVRPPGNLQGALEFIPFDRSSPEKSFGKLMEMISALSPQISGAVAASPEAQTLAASVESASEVEDDAGSDLTPGEDWSRLQFQRAFFKAVYTGRTTDSQQLSNAYLASKDAQPTEQRVSWEAFREHVMLLLGNGNLDRIKSLAAENPENSYVHEILADSLDHVGEHKAAASSFKVSADFAVGRDDRLRLLGRRAAMFARAGARDDTLDTITSMRSSTVLNEGEEVIILNAIRLVSNVLKDQRTALLAMERLAEIDPIDDSLKFDLAYNYADSGSQDLALYQYLKVPYTKRLAATWNNIGVAYRAKSLRHKSVSAYKKSKEMGETLAMANLANVYIEAGFIDEAKGLCDVATQEKDYHASVGTTISRIKEILDEEEEKLQNVLVKARPVSDFRREAGRSLTMRLSDRLASRWRGQTCSLEVTLDGAEFLALGQYAETANSLAITLGNETRARTISVSYTGTLTGMVIQGQVARKPDLAGGSFSLLSSQSEAKDFLMIVESDGSKIKVMERDGQEHFFYSLTNSANS